jgi:hypothetical protein
LIVNILLSALVVTIDSGQRRSIATNYEIVACMFLIIYSIFSSVLSTNIGVYLLSNYTYENVQPELLSSLDQLSLGPPTCFLLYNTGCSFLTLEVS